ncbi:hypothetical protein [Methyloversatilis sp. RAC08]|uniref:hypothetical protein n=1 Tax=Methyloversatilis sp. RAC08 TaxID=1842540 RepID=UPI00083DC7E8|nr:hypothetical protein [Methyloversatilis sp. RAC08]
MKDIEKFMLECESTGVEFSIQTLAHRYFDKDFIIARNAYQDLRRLFIDEHGVEAWASFYARASLLSQHPNFASMDLDDILDDEALKLRLAREVEFRRLLAGVQNVKPFPVIRI